MDHPWSPLAVYLSHRGALLSYASGIVQDRSSAEDVVQEAYLRFTQAVGDDPLEEPVGYLYRIVRNLALDSLRKIARENQLVDCSGKDQIAQAADETPSPEAITLARDDLQHLAAALDALPERTRIALEMRRFGGYKLREIADHLGISISLTHELIADGLVECQRRLRERDRT